MSTPPDAQLRTRLAARTAAIAVIGLGYVGLPLLTAVLGAGYPVLGFDTDRAKLEALRQGERYIRHLPVDTVTRAVADGKATLTADYGRLGACDVIVICVPTPLGVHREPDLSFIETTARALGTILRPGQLVVLESTTYPGTTTGVVKPLLEAGGGLRSGRDFFLAYSPEREDPGNPERSGAAIPRVVGGDGELALELASSFYRSVVREVVPVSSPAVAEAAKLTENIFRAVNIALVNELKVVFTALGIDVWEVIEAARSKPFGFMPFYPGLGLGGHCIPIDPFYLTWKAREVDVATRFIELAGEVNALMPRYVVDRLVAALSSRCGKPLRGARVLLVGMAYKPDVDDTRESPGLRLWELLQARGATVSYHDPHVPTLPRTRRYPELAGTASVALDAATLAATDATVICTAHTSVDHALLVRHCPLVIDTRNVAPPAANVIKA